MASPPQSQLAMHRAVLALLVLVVVTMGFVTWSQPDSRVPFWEGRIPMALFALGLLGATYGSEWARTRSRELVALSGYTVFALFLYSARAGQISTDHVIGLVPCACVAPMMVARRGELVAVTAFALGATMLTWWATPDPGFPQPAFTLILTAITFGLGLASLSRAESQEALAALTLSLEARVAERTSALELSMQRALAESDRRARAEQEALRASDAKSRFLANMSHELRTPINAITGYTEMVLEDLEDQGLDEQVGDLKQVVASAKVLQQLIDDILDLSRIEADELELTLEPVAVRQVVDEAVALVPDLERPGRALQVAVADEVVLADRARLVQVLVNLLVNAGKFTEAGHIAVRAVVEGPRVGLAVEDTGIGIPESQQASIFRRFTQVDSTPTRTHAGVGLGLAICQRLTEGMGGQLALVSTPGEGSTFTVWLTRADEA